MSKLAWVAVSIVVSASFTASGCGPELTAPGATGQISILPGQATDGFTTIEMRLQEDENGGQLDLRDVVKDGNQVEDRVALEDLPIDYTLEHPEVGSSTEQWRVVVWLSTTEQSDSPVSGDFLGSELFSLADCTGSFDKSATFCGVTTGVDVLIDAIVQ